ncbi:MAG: hypothetical protein JSW06_04965 [Thermoplasmatales archaeon]|nr:MAG: hypothetical protein JSW06_04965 [Thermoplasmatales archaeon]
MEKKGKPPSREKYEANYPNWTVRMPKEWHVVTEVFLRESNLSRRQFIGIALKIQKINFERVRWQGWNDGYSIGFGPTVVTVTAEVPESSDVREQSGFVLLFFIYVNPSGGV